MLKKILRKTFVFFICHLLAYAPLIHAAQLSLSSGDIVAPTISQSKYVDSVTSGSNHKVTVTVTDNIAVQQVMLYYRVIGTQNYKSKLMPNIINTDNYQISIKADEIKSPGIEYYIQATDTAGNTLLHGYSFSPLSVKTVGAGADIAANKSHIPVPSEDESIFSNKWLWIGLGVLVVGAAVSGGGGGGDSGAAPTGATLTINAVEPNN